jgi:hypothetical protein
MYNNEPRSTEKSSLVALNALSQKLLIEFIDSCMYNSILKGPASPWSLPS